MCIYVHIVCLLFLISFTNPIMEHNLNFNIFQWNCRSINRNLPYLLEYLAHTKDTQHILCIQSPNVKYSDLPRIEGYYYPPAVSNKDDKVRTATYVHMQCNYTQTKSPIANIPNTVYATTIQVITNNKEINIVNIYYPTGCTEPEHVDWLTNLDKTVGWIVTGDFNARHPTWERGLDSAQTGGNLVDQAILDSDLVLLNDGTPTRLPDVATHSPTAIDLTLVSADLATDTYWTVLEDPLRSDHCPLLLTLEREFTHKPTNKRTRFNYDKADWVLFRNVLTDTCIQTEGSIEECYNNIRAAILTAAEQSIPTYGNKKDRTNVSPWWNDDCQKAVRSKRKAYHFYRKHPNARTFTERKEAEATCEHTIAKAKLDYFKQINEKITDYTGLTEAWRRLKAVKRRNVHYEPPLIVNGVKTKNNKEKAHILAQTFAKASQSASLPKNERVFRQKKEQTPDPPVQNDLVFNALLTKKELLAVLKRIKSVKKATGPDLVSYVMLGNLPDRTVEVLLPFFQRCWEEGNIPQAWRDAEVVGIPKPGKQKSSPENYRPIALTPHIGKLYERILTDRLNYHLEKNNIIPNYQAGFRKHRSCADHVVNLSTHIKKAMVRNSKVFATFFDIKGAYDSVWHNKLLFKLGKIGICGRLYTFIKRFLEGRTLRVRVGNDISRVHNIDMGVPQGSIIAPTLFNIMLYDLDVVKLNCTKALFADDLAIWREVFNKEKRDNYVKALKQHQEDMDRITVYMAFNGFTLSASKTVFMVFSRTSRAEPKLSTYLYDTKIEESPQVKFLGVIFSKNLNWSPHINYLIKKSRPALNLIKSVARERWATDPKVLTTLVGALVRSRLLYGCEAYFNVADQPLKALARIETRALKAALDLPQYARNKLVYKRIDWLPIEQEIHRRCTNYMVRAQNAANPTQQTLTSASSNAVLLLHIKRVSPDLYTKTVTISDYCTKVLSESGVCLANIIRPVPATLPLWEVESPTIDLSLSETSKTHQPNILSVMAKEKISNMQHYLQIYTDGSKMSNHVGSAFVLPQLKVTKRYQLKSYNSVFTAELWAIYMCLEYLNSMPSPPIRVAIFSDSKAALLAIQNNSRLHRNLIHDIYHTHNQLHIKGTESTLVWIPSHLGIRGNDLADRAAKDAALGNAASPIDLGISPQEAKNSIKNYILTSWHKELQERKATNTNIKIILKQKGCLFRWVAPSRRKVMLRILTDSLASKFTPARCECGLHVNQEHVFSDCPTMFTAFKTLREKFQLNNTKFSLEECISEGPNGWGPLEWTADAICLSTYASAF